MLKSSVIVSGCCDNECFSCIFSIFQNMCHTNILFVKKKKILFKKKKHAEITQNLLEFKQCLIFQPIQGQGFYVVLDSLALPLHIVTKSVDLLYVCFYPLFSLPSDQLKLSLFKHCFHKDISLLKDVHQFPQPLNLELKDLTLPGISHIVFLPIHHAL